MLQLWTGFRTGNRRSGEQGTGFPVLNPMALSSKCRVACVVEKLRGSWDTRQPAEPMCYFDQSIDQCSDPKCVSARESAQFTILRLCSARRIWTSPPRLPVITNDLLASFRRSDHSRCFPFNPGYIPHCGIYDNVVVSRGHMRHSWRSLAHSCPAFVRPSSTTILGLPSEAAARMDRPSDAQDT